MFGLFAIGVALPSVSAAFADNPDAELLAQLIGGAAGLSFAISSPIIGGLIERFGYRRVYVLSLSGFAVIGTVPVLLNSLELILATRLLLGITVAGAITSGMAGLGTLPSEIRARMFGRHAVSSSLGAIVCFPLVGALSEYGWRVPFFLHLLALAMIPLALTLDSTPPRHAGHDGESADGATPPSGLGVPVGMLMIAAFIGLVMYVGPIFSPFYVSEIGVTDPRLAAIPLSAMSAGSLLTTTNYGRLHDRFGTTVLFGATLALVGSGLVLAGFSPSLPFFAASMMILACGLALFTPNMGSYITSTSARPARGLGWAMSAMFAVQAAFPFVAKAIEDALGPKAVFLVFGFAALALALMFSVRARVWHVRKRNRLALESEMEPAPPTNYV